jgi:hypothetical protein
MPSTTGQEQDLPTPKMDVDMNVEDGLHDLGGKLVERHVAEIWASQLSFQFPESWMYFYPPFNATQASGWYNGGE